MTLLRLTIGVLLAIHGCYRVGAGGVVPFGDFLSSRHLPLAHALAWALTAIEIVGGPTLATGALIRPLCAWFIVELAAGLVLVHAPEGWFVVGGGRNGMEYSVLLIVCLWVVAATAQQRH